MLADPRPSLTSNRAILAVRALHPPSGRASDAGRHPPWLPGVHLSGPQCETGQVPPPGDASRLTCSARACREDARWALRWNNPRLHEPQRRKTWLACPSHRDSLGGFLSVRGFLRETLDVTDLDPDADGPRAAGADTGSGPAAAAVDAGPDRPGTPG